MEIGGTSQVGSPIRAKQPGQSRYRSISLARRFATRSLRSALRPKSLYMVSQRPSRSRRTKAPVIAPAVHFAKNIPCSSKKLPGTLAPLRSRARRGWDVTPFLKHVCGTLDARLCIEGDPDGPIDGQDLRIVLLCTGRSNTDWLLRRHFGKSKLQFGGRLVCHTRGKLRRRLLAPAGNQFHPVPTTVWDFGLL